MTEASELERQRRTTRGGAESSSQQRSKIREGSLMGPPPFGSDMRKSILKPGDQPILPEEEFPVPAEVNVRLDYEESMLMGAQPQPAFAELPSMLPEETLVGPTTEATVYEPSEMQRNLIDFVNQATSRELPTLQAFIRQQAADIPNRRLFAARAFASSLSKAQKITFNLNLYNRILNFVYSKKISWLIEKSALCKPEPTDPSNSTSIKRLEQHISNFSKFVFQYYDFVPI